MASQQSSHRTALSYANTALTHICLYFTDYHNTLKAKKSALRSAAKQSEQCKALPVVEFVLSKLKRQSKGVARKPPQLEKRSVLGVQCLKDWTCSYSLSDMITLEPLTHSDVKKHLSHHSLLKQVLSIQICLLISAFFSVATEGRLLAAGDSGKTAHLKALELCRAFLPKESPLFTHVNSMFLKHYAQLEGPRKDFKQITFAKGRPNNSKSPFRRKILRKNNKSRAESASRQRTAQAKPRPEVKRTGTARKNRVVRTSREPTRQTPVSSESSIDCNS